ncbi:VWA domain-containing protein [Gulosibacter sp. 10]|uniref:vWA domain-containing protein n=1 Tax=Gulosibacter sp. 10 TaxID=1255570 RepID=UPI00097F465E|nr:VWA domain-containing protein [Gulosibacter sp. 10]SJM48405.1 BatB [Gulosibacter sp. 10]
MTFDPIMPAPLLLLAAAALLAWAGYCAFRADRRARLRWLGRIAMVAALVVALARPGIGQVSAEVADESVDVLFVVDTSASIAAQDWDGEASRLDGVVEDIGELAAQHAGARYSVVTFGSYAVQRLPFTTDATALGNALDRLQPESVQNAQGSSIGAAAPLVEEVLDGARRDYPDRVRVVYYLGDGEQTAAGEIESFADSAELIQGGAVLGYGTEAGGRMPEYGEFGPTGSFVKDRNYEDAVSRIDEGNLEAVAEELDVPYAPRSADAPVEAAEVDASRGQSLDSSSTQLTTFPLYWVFALVVLGWLLLEGWFLGRAANELRSAREMIE